MEKISKTSWGTRYKLDRGPTYIEFTKSAKRINSSLKAGGTLLGYGAGWIIGTGLEIIPGINEGIPLVFETLSGIEMNKENISGLVGVLFGFTGLSKSGVKLNHDMTIQRIHMSPIFDTNEFENGYSTDNFKEETKLLFKYIGNSFKKKINLS